MNENLTQARRRLESVRLKLLRPTVETLDAGAAELNVAVQCLERLESELSSPGPRDIASRGKLESEILLLSRELQHVNTLLVSAGKFYQGWARLLANEGGDAPLNYTAAGKPGPVIPIDTRRLVIHG